MDGSGIDFVIMPVVILPCLVLWLGGIYYAAAHLKWRDAPSYPPPDLFQRETLVTSGPVHVPGPRAETVIPGVVEMDRSEEEEEEKEATAS